MKKATHSFFLAVVVSAVLLPVFASPHDPIGKREAIQIRGLLAPETSTVKSPDSTTAAPTTTEAAATSTSQTPSTTAAAATSTTQATSTTPSSPPAGETTTHANPAVTSSTPEAPVTSIVPTTATNAAGQIITSYVITTPTTSSLSASPSHTSSPDDSSGGLSTGSIVGLSVSGGIAALGIVLFFVWKFTRKQFADFDDNEAIKWPELNSHNNDVHALPTNSTGRAGFGPENDSDINLTRAPSPGGVYASSIAASVPETFSTADPYAVPPLPHLNPNQPYRDEPGAYGQPGFYDPYRGPVPNTFADNVADPHGTESIPMTQMARMRSPGPQGYDMQGRGSPAPQAAMGYPVADERSRTPVPGASSTGRASPSPHPGYGFGSR